MAKAKKRKIVQKKAAAHKRKTAASKSTAARKKAPARKAASRKAARPAGKKFAAKKAARKASPAKKPSTKPLPAKKPAAKKSRAKKTAGRERPVSVRMNACRTSQKSSTSGVTGTWAHRRSSAKGAHLSAKKKQAQKYGFDGLNGHATPWPNARPSSPRSRHQRQQRRPSGPCRSSLFIGSTTRSSSSCS